jgi:serum/glucocorticoid-regulated kinase 2
MLQCIGVGGFSKVYLARDKRDGEFYAAKFIQK